MILKSSGELYDNVTEEWMSGNIILILFTDVISEKGWSL